MKEKPEVTSSTQEKAKVNEESVLSRLLQRLGIVGVESADTDVEAPTKRQVETWTDAYQYLKELAEQGFTIAWAAAGDWTIQVNERGFKNEERLIYEIAAEHPEGRVVAVSEYKFYTNDGHTARSRPIVSEFPGKDGYDEHTAEWELQVGPARPLLDVVSDNETES